ncbi:fatty acyl-AMP ligase [Nocardia sp. NBC_01503]|uniref:fatty acyl-AMP ligase n=1 Tax=Nocardia sp. NBC_01503 TaxID=2975997 RepID=UPI002E7BD1B0|nr:fatty acyl-AMP ligase [Nocardia sp. NBC_01503]WTL30223.1 fatty acyl-AMP ligase [Nocardia sp. NBC_01503]
MQDLKWARGPRTLVDIVAARIAETPARTAFTFVGPRAAEDVIDYRGLGDRVAGVARQVLAATAPGDRVALLCPPGKDFAFAFYACLVTGRIAVAVSLPSSTRQLSTLTGIIRDSGAVAAIVPLSAIPITSAQLGVDIRIIDSDTAEPGAEWSAELESAPGPDDIAFLQYTSGSTGTPKGVAVLHRNLMRNLELITAKCELTPDISVVSWLPPFHDMGLIQGLLLPAFLGAPGTLMSPMTFLRDPLTWLREISRNSDVLAGGPNLAYGLCLKRVSPSDAAGLDLGGWRIAFAGAEPIDPNTLRRFADMFAVSGFRDTSFVPMYGLAESTLYVNGGRLGVGATSRPFAVEELERGTAREHSAGRELLSMGPVEPDSTVVVDPETRERCAPNQVGEIWLRGPSVAAGYWNKPGETERAFDARIANEDGPAYLRTGDLGFLCDAELYVSGRIKELMIVHGRNIFPQDIERTILSSHPSLRPGGCAVFAASIDDEERVMVVQELADEPARDDTEALAISIRDIVSRVHAVSLHQVVFVGKGEVPKTTSGKVQRQRLREHYSSVTALQESGI